VDARKVNGSFVMSKVAKTESMTRMNKTQVRGMARLAAASLLTTSLAACTAVDDAPSQNRSSVNPVAMSPVLPALLEDAARRSGVPTARLHVVAVESVTWRDGALGCPQPNMSYPQVLVPGWRVRIAERAAVAVPLDYHVSARGGWLHCPAGQAQTPLPREADPRI
jgi:hypothetical protein